MRVTPFPAFVSHVSARRGALDFAPPLRPLHPEKVWEQLQSRTAGNRSNWLGRAKNDPHVVAALAMIAAGKLPDPFDARTVAVAERLIHRGYMPTEHDTFVRLVAEAHGVAAMVAMKLESSAIHLHHDEDHVTFDGDDPSQHDLAWDLARTLVCRADDASYAAAREVAAKWRASHPLTARIIADFLFCEEAEWASADVAEMLAQLATAHASLWYRTLPLLALARDPDQAMTLVDALQPYGLAQCGGKFACDLAVNLADRGAVRVLRSILDRVGKNAGKTQLAGLGAAMCALEGEEMAAELAGLLLHSPIGPMAVDYFRRFPALARAVLPKVASGTSKAADAARSILAASTPKQDLPLAAAEEIPAVLRDAPWRKKKKGKPVTLGELPPPPETTIEWAAGERERVLAESGQWYGNMPEMPEGAVEEWEKIRPEYRAVDMAWLRWSTGHTHYRVPGARSIREWNENPKARAQLGAMRMLALHGEAVLPGLFARDAFGADWTGESIFHAQLHTVGPVAARVAAAALLRRKAWRKEAQDWIVAHPGVVARALLPAALGKDGKERKEAESAVRIAARARRDDVLEAARALGPEAEHGAKELLDRDPLTDLEVKGKLPPFVRVEDLPPLLTRAKKRLPDEALVALLEILRSTSPDMPYAGLDAVREALDEASLGELAWALVQAWILAGAKGTFEWIPLSLALVGDDACARRLAPHVREWARKDAKKAKLAVDVLAAMGSSAALLHLSYVADKSRFEDAKKHARETLERVAAQQGLTTDELADRTVPDLELDADGTTTLDFGARKFVVTFDEGLRPIVKGEDGARLPAFPRATKTDDATLAKAASARFKALKADAETIAQSLLRRFEAAMVRGRTWRADSLRTYVLGHPLVTHVARRLVWRAGAATFRVAEDGTLADANDAEYALPDDAVVTLPHPLELGRDAVVTWSRIFSDYAVVQPFEQLARATYSLDDAELATNKLLRFEGRKSKAGPLMGSLDARGWQKWPDETSLSSAGKTLRKKAGGEATAALSFSPGIDLGDVAGTPEQALSAVSLQGASAWGEVNDIDLSELVRDLEAIAH